MPCLPCSDKGRPDSRERPPDSRYILCGPVPLIDTTATNTTGSAKTFSDPAAM